VTAQVSGQDRDSNAEGAAKHEEWFYRASLEFEGGCGNSLHHRTEALLLRIEYPMHPPQSGIFALGDTAHIFLAHLPS